jgi:hypothetical protein
VVGGGWESSWGGRQSRLVHHGFGQRHFVPQIYITRGHLFEKETKILCFSLSWPKKLSVFLTEWFLGGDALIELLNFAYPNRFWVLERWGFGTHFFLLFATYPKLVLHTPSDRKRLSMS